MSTIKGRESLTTEQVKSIIALPSPETSFLANAGTQRLVERAEVFSCLMLALVNDKLVLPKGTFNGKCPVSGKDKLLRGACIWSRVFYALGSHYNFIQRKLVQSDPTNMQNNIPGVVRNAPDELCKTHIRKNSPQYKLTARFITCKYMGLLSSIQAKLHLRASPQMQHLTELCEHVSHDSLNYLQEMSASIPSGCHKLLIEQIIQSSVYFLAKTYEVAAKTTNLQHKPGILSSIRLAELSLLASRDAAIISKYGEKRVERIFEDQLSSLFHLMGFYVVPARVGEQTGDIICISSDPTCSMTMLVEAKTSGKPYVLPTKDSRAIQDYVAEIRRRMKSLPTLRLVLIVGQEPGKTLEAKLRTLQASTGLPVRFCHAREIANLCESFPISMSLALFIDTILHGSNVVSKATVNRIAEQSQKIQGAHVDLVRSCMESCHPGDFRAEGHMRKCIDESDN